MLPGNLHQGIRIKLGVWDKADIFFSADFYILHIDGKITKNGLAHPEPVVYGPGTVQGFSGTGRPAVKYNHNSTSFPYIA